MSAPVKINFKVYQGSTFREVFRWESSTKVYVPIQAIAKSAPVLITTSEPHGIPVGWRARVTGVSGMKEINSTVDQYHVVTGTTINTLEFNEINATTFTTYTSGGIVEYNQPVPLNGYTGRLQIRQKVDSADIILELTTENDGVVIDTAYNTITIQMTDEQTAAFNFQTAVYSLELQKNGEVVAFCNGNLTLVKEVTR